MKKSKWARRPLIVAGVCYIIAIVAAFSETWFFLFWVFFVLGSLSFLLSMYRSWLETYGGI